MDPPSKVQQRPQGAGSRVRPCGKGVGGGRTRRVSGSRGMWLEAGARQCWGLRHPLPGKPQQCCPVAGRGQGLKLRRLWCACTLHALRCAVRAPGRPPIAPSEQPSPAQSPSNPPRGPTHRRGWRNAAPGARRRLGLLETSWRAPMGRLERPVSGRSAPKSVGRCPGSGPAARVLRPLLALAWPCL